MTTRAERRRRDRSAPPSDGPRYFRDGGDPTSADDPKRMIWYAIGCTYWTDDWNHVAVDRTPPRDVTYPDGSKGRVINPGAVPHCPRCGSVGFQGEFGKWLESAKEYEAGKQPHQPNPQPGYVAALLWGRERCFRSYVDLRHAASCERLH